MVWNPKWIFDCAYVTFLNESEVIKAAGFKNELLLLFLFWPVPDHELAP